MITLYYDNTSIDIEPADASYRYRAIMGDDRISLTFDYAGYLDLPVGTYCTIDGTQYTLVSPQGFTKNGSRQYEYRLDMYAPYYVAKRCLFRNLADGRHKFSISATPRQMLELVVGNLNDRDSAQGWTAGDCFDYDAATLTDSGTPALMDFSATTVLAALNTAADKFNTEWHISGKTVNLCRKANPDARIELSYGGDKGFKPGVKRSNADETGNIERIYVQGGERNISLADYGSSTLLLPKGGTLNYDPLNDAFEGGTGYESANARAYVASTDGHYIERGDKSKTTNYEDSFDGSDYYPSRVGTVTSVSVSEGGIVSVTDTSIDFNYEDYVLGTGTDTMTLVFQTGMLAGREFDVDYTHSTRSFALSPIEVDGQTMPRGTYMPQAGNKYAVFGVSLPAEYTADDAAKTGASWEMFRAAVRYMALHEDARYTFGGSLDPVYAHEHWSAIGPLIALGNYVTFSDTQFLPAAENIRIVGIKDYINDPYAPELELSNLTISATGLTGRVQELEGDRVKISAAEDNALRYSKRGFTQATAAQASLRQAVASLSDSYTDGIQPISVKTMSMIVGDTRLQFKFVTAVGGDTPDTSFVLSYDADAATLTAPATVLKHLTLGLDVTAEGARKDSDYRYWAISSASISTGDLWGGALYVYADCSNTTQTGELIVSADVMDFEDDASYCFLLGILSAAESDGSRSFMPLYGYTEVAPTGITTGRVVSADGNTYIDLAGNKMRMGGSDDNYILWDGAAGKFTVNGLLLAAMAYVDKLGVRNVAIRDSLGNTVGGMTTYDSDEGSTPYLWLGAAAPENAPFRVDGNGKILATDGQFKGKVEADSGSIGNFDIQSNGWLKADSDVDGGTYGVALSSGTISLESNDYQSAEGTHTAIFAAHSYPSPYSGKMALLALSTALTPLSGKTDYSTSNKPNVALQISASGANLAGYTTTGTAYGGNFAVWCDAGMFAGLRPHLRLVTGTAARLTNTDHTVVVNNSSDCTITLPQAPEVGQEFELWHTSTTTLKVQSDNADVRKYIMGSDATYAYVFSSTKREVLRLKYAHGLHKTTSTENGMWLLMYYGAA